MNNVRSWKEEKGEGGKGRYGRKNTYPRTNAIKTRYMSIINKGRGKKKGGWKAGSRMKKCGKGGRKRTEHDGLFMTSCNLMAPCWGGKKGRKNESTSILTRHVLGRERKKGGNSDSMIRNITTKGKEKGVNSHIVEVWKWNLSPYVRGMDEKERGFTDARYLFIVSKEGGKKRGIWKEEASPKDVKPVRRGERGRVLCCKHRRKKKSYRDMHLFRGRKRREVLLLEGGV